MDKILRGAKPGGMPIEVITGMVIFNLRAARAIGVTVPKWDVDGVDCEVGERTRSRHRRQHGLLPYVAQWTYFSDVPWTPDSRIAASPVAAR